MAVKIYLARDIKAADERAISGLGIASTLLMERAAKALVEAALPRLSGLERSKITIFCGSGNNGGDGLAAARLLKQRGLDVLALLTGRRESMSPDCLEMERRYEEIGGVLEDFSLEGLERRLEDSELVIDAMFGVGLHSELRGAALEAAKLINSTAAYVLSADLPSGIEADSGRVLGEAVKADLTLSFSALKFGLVSHPGAAYAGKVEVADIGIPDEAFKGLAPAGVYTDEALIDTIIPVRKRDSHKGDYGRVLLICGAKGYAGAAVLASKAALRSGSGLVCLAVPESIYGIAAVKCPDEVMVYPLACDSGGRISLAASAEIERLLKGSDACLIGPGLSRSEELEELVRALVEKSKVPLVIDADGINNLSPNINILVQAGCPIVLTPHGGEFQRLGGAPEPSPWSGALDFAEKYGVTLLLKGNRTVSASAGGRVFVNSTGNPGMASGGSGDVLSGMLLSLLGQGIEPSSAAAAAAYLHGLAGDRAAARLGEYGMTAGDIIDEIPAALKKYMPR